MRIETLSKEDNIPCWCAAYMVRDRLTPADMARKLKITERTWRNWMADPGLISVSNLMLIASIFNCDAEDLFREV